MTQKKKTVVLLVLVWLGLFVASYVMSTRIEGPRNIDTGFRRLDVLAQYQIIAFAVALMSALAGIVWRRDSRRIMLIGLVPLLATGLLVASIAVAALILSNRSAPTSPPPAFKPTTNADEPVPQAPD